MKRNVISLSFSASIGVIFPTVRVVTLRTHPLQIMYGILDRSKIIRT